MYMPFGIPKGPTIVINVGIVYTLYTLSAAVNMTNCFS